MVEWGKGLPGFEANPEVVRRYIRAGICPWCGRGSFRVLASHTTRMHGVDRLALRDLAGLTKDAVICSDEVHAERVVTLSMRPPPAGSNRGAAREYSPEGARRRRAIAQRNLTPEGRQRGLARAVPLAADRKNSRAECKHGHPYTAGSVYRRASDGARVCRPCGRERMAAFRLARKERADVEVSDD